MCRVLVWYKEKPRFLKDELKHEQTRTIRGDPIVVMPDGHEWGREEGLPNFVSLDLDGVPVEEIKAFARSEESPILTPSGKPYVKRKRAFSIQLDKLPQAVQDGLRKDGKAQASLADLKGRVLHKESGIAR